MKQTNNTFWTPDILSEWLSFQPTGYKNLLLVSSGILQKITTIDIKLERSTGFMDVKISIYSPGSQLNSLSIQLEFHVVFISYFMYKTIT